MVHLKAPESGVGWSVRPLTHQSPVINQMGADLSQPGQSLGWGCSSNGQHSHFNLEMILTQDHKSTFISYEYFCVVVLCDEKCTYIIKEKFIFFKPTPESS